jgi:hypothetical protein
MVSLEFRLAGFAKFLYHPCYGENQKYRRLMMLNDMSVQMSREMHDCTENCLNCHSICLATVNHCLGMGGAHATSAHITLMLDCAEMCQTSANFMLRNSALHERTCGICAEICTLCAGDCERIDPNDSQMRACAEMCRQCAQSCREMAQMAA